MKHNLKTDPEPFNLSWNKNKPWEIRLNDRDFQTGDTYCLFETVYSEEQMQQGDPLEYTGRIIQGVITGIILGPQYAVPEGWLIFTSHHFTFNQIDPLSIVEE